MRRLSHALLLPLAFAASAGADELQDLYGALNMLNQQQQAIYQQFQMVQELRVGSVPRVQGPMFLSPAGKVTNYDEVVEAQKRALERSESLYRQADQLLARYNEIEDMKKPLQQRIYDLSLKK
jgi:hypothetical protein